MKYEEPEITTTHSAIAVVQGGMKDHSQVLDSFQLETIGAYEADE